MKQDSLLFVHHFCHKTFAYHFEVYLLQTHALSQNFLLDDMFVLSDEMKVKEMISIHVGFYCQKNKLFSYG